MKLELIKQIFGFWWDVFIYYIIFMLVVIAVAFLIEAHYVSIPVLVFAVCFRLLEIFVKYLAGKRVEND